jgi:hypothetical protein
MKQVDLFFKVEVDIEAAETVERVAKEIVRALEKMYGVRRAELSNVVPRSED